jgi:hypothetical protein
MRTRRSLLIWASSEASDSCEGEGGRGARASGGAAGFRAAQRQDVDAGLARDRNTFVGQAELRFDLEQVGQIL